MKCRVLFLLLITTSYTELLFAGGPEVQATQNGQKIISSCPGILSAIGNLVVGNGKITAGTVEELGTILRESGYPKDLIPTMVQQIMTVYQNGFDHEVLRSFLQLVSKKEVTDAPNMELLACGASADCLFDPSTVNAPSGLKQIQLATSFAGLKLVSPTEFRRTRTSSAILRGAHPHVVGQYALGFRLSPDPKDFTSSLEFIDAVSQWIGQYFREGATYANFKLLTNWFEANLKLVEQGKPTDELFNKYVRVEADDIAIDEAFLHVFLDSRSVDAWSEARKIFFLNQLKGYPALNDVLKSTENGHRSGGFKGLIKKIGDANIVQNEFGLSPENIFERGRELGQQMQRTIDLANGKEIARPAEPVKTEPRKLAHAPTDWKMADVRGSLRHTIQDAFDPVVVMRRSQKMEVADRAFGLRLTSIRNHVDGLADSPAKKNLQQILGRFAQRAQAEHFPFAVSDIPNSMFSVGSYSEGVLGINVDMRNPVESLVDPHYAEGELIRVLTLLSDPEINKKPPEDLLFTLYHARAEYWSTLGDIEINKTAYAKESVALLKRNAFKQEWTALIQRERAEQAKARKEELEQTAWKIATTDPAFIRQFEVLVHAEDTMGSPEVSSKTDASVLPIFEMVLQHAIVGLGKQMRDSATIMAQTWADFKRAPTGFDAQRLVEAQTTYRKLLVYKKMSDNITGFMEKFMKHHGIPPSPKLIELIGEAASLHESLGPLVEQLSLTGNDLRTQNRAFLEAGNLFITSPQMSLQTVSLIELQKFLSYVGDPK